MLVAYGSETDGGNDNGSTLFLLPAPPSGNSVVAPGNVTEHIENFRLFSDARPFAVMHQDGDRRDFADASFGGKNFTNRLTC